MLVKVRKKISKLGRIWESLPEESGALDDSVVQQVLEPIGEGEIIGTAVIVFWDPVTSAVIDHVVVWTSDAVYTLEPFLACFESC
jgi:hypothetical protein